MRWIEKLVELFSNRKLAQMVSQVARLSEPVVAATVQGHMTGMSAAEARGYVRARARLVVEDRVAFVISSGAMSLPPRMLSATSTYALDRVVGRLVAAHVLAQPTPRAYRRAA